MNKTITTLLGAAALYLSVGCGETPRNTQIGQFEAEDGNTYSVVYDPVKDISGKVTSRIYVASEKDGRTVKEGTFFTTRSHILYSDSNPSRDLDMKYVKGLETQIRDGESRLADAEKEVTNAKKIADDNERKAQLYDMAVEKSKAKNN